ncbi:hypothetical protein [Paenibacillus sedimenti]|uniref:DUF4871 domain-containing protein n=1 Tax=Paenibacillus sedimenti TaxID=2770274 RepID=A0A926KR37_9BACL|nr:hypothetical protein [Paenibacillus sedimenti]MBD0382519.1 hypothetical protein [Paenibacillus sedimenti]
MNSHEEIWTEQLKASPFAGKHFTNELRYNVMQRTKVKKRRIPVVALSVVGLMAIVFLIGYAWLNQGLPFQSAQRSATSAENEWRPSGYFNAGGKSLMGKEGKIGFLKMNGSTAEPFISRNEGIVMQIYFWGKPEQFNGKYKLMATNKDTNEVIPLYEWPINVVTDEIGADARSGAKFGISKSGLWRFDIYVNDVYFDNVIVEVK